MMTDNLGPLEEAVGEYITMGFSADYLGKIKKDGKEKAEHLKPGCQLNFN